MKGCTFGIEPRTVTIFWVILNLAKAASKNSQVNHIVVKGNRLGGFELHKRDTLHRLATIQEIREKARGKNWANVSSSG